MTGPYRSSTGLGAWAEPGPETVAPGVHRVPLPLPGDSPRAVNVYVLESAEGLVLVAGGWDVPEGRAALQDGLAALGTTLRDVSRLLQGREPPGWTARPAGTDGTRGRRRVGGSPPGGRPVHDRLQPADPEGLDATQRLLLG